jgi:GTP cyclohydrolase I
MKQINRLINRYKEGVTNSYSNKKEEVMNFNMKMKNDNKELLYWRGIEIHHSNCKE